MSGRRTALVWVVHHVLFRQPDQRPRTAPTRWLLTRLGRDPSRFGRSASCRQCGDWSGVAVLRLGPRTGRYWCQRCGAVVVAGVDEIRPVAELVPVPVTPSPSPSDALAHGLSEVLPEGMPRPDLTLDQLDKARLYQLYNRWDADRAARGEPRLPGIAAVVAAVQHACYRDEVAAAALGTVEPAVLERVRNARLWLASAGSTLCWIEPDRPDGQLPEADPAAVGRALAALEAGSPPAPEDAGAARLALFGTARGPGWSQLIRAYGEPEVRSALAAYLGSSARPLRVDALRRLRAR